MRLLILSFTFVALAFTGCRHRHQQPSGGMKNPVAYPTAQPIGTTSAGAGYAK